MRPGCCAHLPQNQGRKLPQRKGHQTSELTKARMHPSGQAAQLSAQNTLVEEGRLENRLRPTASYMIRVERPRVLV